MQEITWQGFIKKRRRRRRRRRRRKHKKVVRDYIVRTC